MLDAEQKYLELQAETNQQEETLRAEEEALRQLEGTAAAIQSYITDFVEHVEIHKAQVADRRAAKERWEVCVFKFIISDVNVTDGFFLGTILEVLGTMERNTR